MISRAHHKTAASAAARVRELGFAVKKRVDITPNWYRFRQWPPSNYADFRNKRIAPDVMLVIGWH
jgi:hypothetical protein